MEAIDRRHDWARNPALNYDLLCFHFGFCEYVDLNILSGPGRQILLLQDRARLALSNIWSWADRPPNIKCVKYVGFF